MSWEGVGVIVSLLGLLLTWRYSVKSREVAEEALAIEEGREKAAHERFSYEARSIGSAVEMQAILLERYLALEPAERAIGRDDLAALVTDQIGATVERSSRLLQKDVNAPMEAIRAVQLVDSSLPLLSLRLGLGTPTEDDLKRTRDRLQDLVGAVYDATDTDSSMVRDTAEDLVERFLKTSTSRQP